MNKTNRGILIIGIPILALTLLLFGFSIFAPDFLKGNADNISGVSRLTRGVLPKEYLKGAEIQSSETTQGLFGDRKTMITLKLNGTVLQEQNGKAPENWKPLPIDEETMDNLYGYTREENGYTDVFGGFITDEMIPSNIENGVYYFHDTYAERNPNDTSPFSKRVSFEFEYAVIDYDQNTCYLFFYGK